jgi:tRNA dimethylallyltransferase
VTGPPVVAVVGPTAAGKSELSLALAVALGGGTAASTAAGEAGCEVVNADSMQLYHGMDIGTAKLPPGQRAGIPHHLLDIWDVTEPASVAAYQRLARAAVDGVLARGRVPLLVGGSGLYVRAVLDDLEFPGTDPELRAGLDDELARHGPALLYDRLRRLDPSAAGAILPSNGRRIVRALEVIELTGRPFPARLPEPRPVYRSVRLAVDRDDLDQRIADRVARMWADGLVDEVRGLERRGLRQGRTARAALGYAQVLQFLAGTISEQAAYDETVRATRRFVRRQRSWFRRDRRLVWLDGQRPDLVAAALAAVAAVHRAGEDGGDGDG